MALSTSIPVFSRLEISPDSITIPQPKYTIGAWCCWEGIPQNQTDFGKIVGLIYTSEASCKITGYHYLILLDECSPSRKQDIVISDFAFEEDIKIIDEATLIQLRQYNA